MAVSVVCMWCSIKRDFGSDDVYKLLQLAFLERVSILIIIYYIYNRERASTSKEEGGLIMLDSDTVVNGEHVLFEGINIRKGKYTFKEVLII